MTDDDYATLALRLGDAADLVEEVSAIYGYARPTTANWSAEQLRYEAKKLAQ